MMATLAPSSAENSMRVPLEQVGACIVGSAL